MPLVTITATKSFRVYSYTRCALLCCIDYCFQTSSLLCQLLLTWITCPSSKFECCMAFRIRINGGHETDRQTDGRTRLGVTRNAASLGTAA